VLIGVFFFNLTLDFAGTQNRIGLLLFILIVLAFGSMSSIGFMNRERDQFAQERASGAYMPSAFFIVKVFYDLVPLRIIPSAVLGLLVYYLTGLQNDPSQLAHFLLIIILFNSTTVRFLFYFILNFLTTYSLVVTYLSCHFDHRPQYVVGQPCGHHHASVLFALPECTHQSW